MLKLKGPLFKSTLKFVKEKLGEEKFNDFLTQLPPDVQSFLKTSILSSEFYPADHLIAINETFVKVAELNPFDTYRAIGRRSADEGFSGIYRIFLKVGSPKMMVRQAPLIWKSYYSQGKMEVESPSKNDATIRIHDSGIKHISLCARVGGFVERTEELSGGKDVTSTHTRCFAKGDNVEEWFTTWQ